MHKAFNKALTTAFMDCTDADKGVVSRGTIGSIRDAFAEVVRKFRYAAAARAVAGAYLHARLNAWQVFNVVLTHIHDEASLRLRSFHAHTTSAAEVKRGRSSKVQQHVAHLHVLQRAPPSSWKR